MKNTKRKTMRCPLRPSTLKQGLKRALAATKQAHMIQVSVINNMIRS